MAVTFTPYTQFILGQLTGVDPVDFDADDFALSLHTATYSPDRDVDEYFDDVTAELSSGGGYTTGGITLTGPATVAIDGSGHFVYVDWPDPLWSPLTKTGIRYAVLRCKKSTAATSRLIAFADFGADQAPSGIDFGVVFAAPASGGAVKVG